MALAPCVECGSEISSEAKKCPKCGARNRAYKSKAVSYWLLAVLLCVLGFIIYGRLQYGDDTPACDTPSQREAFASVIDSSAYSLLHRLRVIDITSVKTIKSGMSITDLVCEATISFNSRERGKFRFTWIRSESGALLIQAREMK